jgi:hypothetical protein
MLGCLFNKYFTRVIYSHKKIIYPVSRTSNRKLKLQSKIVFVVNYGIKYLSNLPPIAKCLFSKEVCKCPGLQHVRFLISYLAQQSVTKLVIHKGTKTFSTTILSIMTRTITDIIGTLSITTLGISVLCHWAECHIFLHLRWMSLCWVSWRPNKTLIRSLLGGFLNSALIVQQTFGYCSHWWNDRCRGKKR